MKNFSKKDFVQKLNNYANEFTSEVLSGNDTDHLIDKITPYSDLYGNLIVLSIGPPGTAKTTHFTKEMFMTSES